MTLQQTRLRPIYAVCAREACLRGWLLLFAVVGMVVEDGDGAVELFGQQDATMPCGRVRTVMFMGFLGRMESSERFQTTFVLYVKYKRRFD